MDVDKFHFIRAFLAVKDSAWIDYKWPDPVDKMIKQKSSYLIRVGRHIVGVGYYKSARPARRFRPASRVDKHRAG
jgi:cytochrome c